MNSPKPSKAQTKGVVVGAGAQGRIVAVIWRRADPQRELAFFDDQPTLWGTQVLGIPVSGPVASLEESGFRAAPVIVGLGHNYARTDLARKLEQKAVRFANAIDPTAVIMPEVTIGRGVFVGPQAVVHTGTEVGDHVIINTSAAVEHDGVLETGVSIASGAHVGGRVHVERHAFIATGATIIARVRIGEGAIVGAGAVVTADVPPRQVAYGCPAKVIREATQRDWSRLF